jgi:hypothetical protein
MGPENAAGVRIVSIFTVQRVYQQLASAWRRAAAAPSGRPFDAGGLAAGGTPHSLRLFCEFYGYSSDNRRRG